jgi:hypothetical protein
MTDLGFTEWASVFGDAKMITALLDRLTHPCHIVEARYGSWRFRQSVDARHNRNSEPKNAKEVSLGPNAQYADPVSDAVDCDAGVNQHADAFGSTTLELITCWQRGRGRT